MDCAACGHALEPGRNFCTQCGAPATAACPSCGAANGAGARFCGDCGTVLAPAAVEAAARAPVAERRLVSVLFADLVGFTTASEGRDAEDTRELLSRYFDLARTIVERYGGTVEKFIGDAVMALWGAPVAREDDAERAVRAALDLVEAVPALDPALRARAGVLTGEAAVTLGAAGQGMVAGDLVNTASRIQAAAEPGTVLAGDSTRRATEAAIAYEPAGVHELKGRAEPVALFRALRVTGGEHAGALEAPFVGRTAELRQLKETFHACVDESRARLVSVVGVAGIGKSRLSWEFQKHVEGLVAEVWWHRGRCLSYGDGVAYWALAEMVRSRARIAEADDPASAAAGLRAALEEHVPDASEREWVEPRLLHLLGLADRTAPDREDLFSAWRRFFERLAEQGPLVLVFEDLHWADEGLVAFVEYLLDWGRHLPIFVLTLARPEVADRHPSFPGSTRSVTTIALEPLSDDAMDELLTGLVPGLPDGLRTRLREAADGIPLYAVETVRMLRDRRLIAGDGADVTGDLEALDVPETLHALIAARLDALPETERRLLQDASVLGKTFTRRGLESVSGLPGDSVDELVAQLVRRELLAVEKDPFSAERGQLGFLQALVQRVAYETIARRDRRARHLAAARFLAEGAGLDPDEIAEVIAAHYLDAHEADPDAVDADEVRAQARAWFTRAAERSASLAASLEAQRSFERAAGLAADEVERGRSLARAGELAVMGGRLDEAEPLLLEAIEILDAAGAGSDAAAAENHLGGLYFSTDRLDEGIRRLERALSVYEADGDDEAVATVSAELARLSFFAGRGDAALVHAERALELAERLRLAPVVVEGLINKALILQRRPNESLGLMRQALVLAEEAGVQRGAIRACMNLGYLLDMAGRRTEAEAATGHGIALARRLGDRVWERSLVTNLIQSYFDSGRWDEAEQAAAELPDEGAIATDPVHASTPLTLAEIALKRGQPSRAVALAAPFTGWMSSPRTQAVGVGIWARVLTALAEGRDADAAAECVRALCDERLRVDAGAVVTLGALGSEGAWLARLEEPLAELVEAGSGARTVSKPVDAAVQLCEARLAVLRGEPEPRFAEAASAFRALDDPYGAATALLEHAEWLAAAGRAEEAAPLLAEARKVFERLSAAPRLERVAQVESALGQTREVSDFRQTATSSTSAPTSA